MAPGAVVNAKKTLKMPPPAGNDTYYVHSFVSVLVGKNGPAVREGVTVNQFWKVLLGADPKVISINDKTDLSTIKAAATAASKIPTIGASRDDQTIDERSAGKVTNWHGYAVLGLRGSNIALYDPHRKKLELSLTEFRSYFQAIFYGNP